MLQDESAVFADGELETAAALHHEAVVYSEIRGYERVKRYAGLGRSRLRGVVRQHAALEILIQHLEILFAITVQ